MSPSRQGRVFRCSLRRGAQARPRLKLSESFRTGTARGRRGWHLARVLWHQLKFKQAFDWNVFAREEEKMKRQKRARLQNLAASLNYQLVPNQ